MNLCSIFVGIIVGFVTLTENMMLIEVVPVMTGVFHAANNAFEGCLLYLSCSLFLHRICFRSVRMALLVNVAGVFLKIINSPFLFLGHQIC